ncbi:integral membrane [Fusarium sporotrichioides]|uniref:Integral membrane n=1 Tax=Fusarium sporotrichioides TaxID=5514 RepID=A0A395SFM8_FUSSP|nr:integral membrane [Fusarium sporotrichioides]
MATPIGHGPQSIAETTGDRLITVLVVVIFSILVSLLVLILRMWCRWSRQALGWDDFAALMSSLCITAFGSGLLALIPIGLSDPTGKIPADKISAFYKCTYIAQFFYGQALFWAKMSFVLLYYRIVSMSYWRWTYIGAIVFLVLWNISIILIFFLTCIPMTAIWDLTVKGRCLRHAMELGYICAGISIFTDLVVAALPLPFIWKLNLRRSQKIALSGVFLLGCFSIALAIMRIRWASFWSITAWDIARPQLWGLAEVTSALICACIPTFKPLLVRLNDMRPRCTKTNETTAVRHQRSDDEIGLNMETVAKVASQSQESSDEDPHRTLRAQSYGTNTYVIAKQFPWGK